MQRWVEIEFDCLPLRSIGRMDIPLDASPKYQKHCMNLKQALEKHGALNTFYLYNAQCVYHLLNHETDGMLEFRFEGTVLTNADDTKARQADLDVSLTRETCSWLSEPIVEWFASTVSRSVLADFDRYIAAGDLSATEQRIQKIQAESDESGGFVGMYL
ncbi:hypothetical protein M4951_19610 [Blastopirellula sp. J2-11]|uniref:hypothetical protein n=1 Tax=Blastopirellula sp. J2-11 TaxID=2943192 RepID=UPI0021CA8B9B|nr:hypothetical protein [Blastopirellula sp. J2-11]UUO05571.1 hypothetical protein M4951_19610 [Blastopirellula sp. J2-11]